MTELDLLLSIDAKLGYILGLLIFIIVVKFLWNVFAEWFFGGV